MDLTRLKENALPGILPILLIVLAMLALPPGAHAGASLRWLNANGDMHSLEDYRGKAALVHIWASWCPPCRAEMPDMNTWVHDHPEVLLLPISVDQSAGAAQAFLDGHGIGLPLLLTDQTEAAGFGVRVLPSTFLISAEGEITRRLPGSQRWANGAFSDALLADIGLR